MAGVAQLVRAPVCGTGCRRFKSGHSPHLFETFSSFQMPFLLTRSGFFGYRCPSMFAVGTNSCSICGRGEIGRRARFRFWYLTMWGFKSLRPHHSFSPNRHADVRLFFGERQEQRLHSTSRLGDITSIWQ